MDKSVHAGLWLNLVNAVFPDAVYIHMVRSPRTCVPSMIQGWENSKRFQTYRVPESVATAAVGYLRTTGVFQCHRSWNKHYQKDLVDICSFQWKAIHDAILQYLARPPSQTGYSEFISNSWPINLEPSCGMSLSC